MRGFNARGNEIRIHGADRPDEGQTGRRWLILATVAIAQLMVVLDATIMNIALPSAQRTLQFSDTDRQWIITAYALAFGSLLLFCGRLSDLLGPKLPFLIGLLGFGCASAVGGAATSLAMLVVARASQGVFGALVAPSALAVLTTTFDDPRERGRAFGIYGAIAGGGGAIGLLLGGALTQYLSWRWCLYVNVVFVGTAASAGMTLLSSRGLSSTKLRLDIPGVVTVTASMFCLVYGFSNAGTHNWHAPSTSGFLAAGVGLLAVFAFWESHSANPLLPPSIVLHRNRGAAYLSVLIASAGMFGIFLFLTYYLQLVLGYSPVVTGLAFLPLVAAVIVSANVGQIVLMPRTGPKPLVTVGMVLAAGGTAWLTRIGVHSDYAVAVLGPMLLAGAGLGQIIAPSTNTGTFGMAPADVGVASASVNTSQQLGGSLGTALLNTIAIAAATGYLSTHWRPGTTVNGRPSAYLIQLGLVHGYSVAFWYTAAIFVIGALFSAALFRRGPLQPQRNEHAPHGFQLNSDASNHRDESSTAPTRPPTNTPHPRTDK